MYGIKLEVSAKCARIIEIPDIWTERTKEKYCGRILAGGNFFDAQEPFNKIKPIIYSSVENEVYIILSSGDGKLNRAATYYAGREIYGNALLLGKQRLTKTAAELELRLMPQRLQDFKKLRFDKRI